LRIKTSKCSLRGALHLLDRAVNIWIVEYTHCSLVYWFILGRRVSPAPICSIAVA
jgi:hypothetical protein